MQPSSATTSQGQRSQHNDDDNLLQVIPRSPSSKALAPYAPKSEAEDLSLQELIDYYAKFVIEKTVTSPGPRKEWFPFTVTNAAFFHAVIGSTASHLAYKRRVEADNVDYFYHRGQAISLVNKAISDGEGATEGVIATVACFVQQDSLAAASHETKQHVNGIVQLVKMIGGIRSPDISGKTRRLVLLGDLAASIVLSGEPRLEPTLLDPNISTYFKQPSRFTRENAQAFGIRLFNFTDLQNLSDIAANVFWGLRNITELLDGFKAGTENEVLDADEEEVQYSDRVEVIERATHSLWYNDPKDPTTLVFRLFGSATLIYIYTVLRELPPELRIMKLVAMRMKEQIEKAQNLNVLLATFPDLMLWILFLGGQVAEPQRKPFFARQASKILLMKKIEKQEEILNASQIFLWPEKNAIEEEEEEEPEDVVEYRSGSEDLLGQFGIS